MEADTARLGRSMETAGKRGWIMNQALFTMRRLVYGTTLALGASGFMALRWGWQFNSAMQQAQVALRPVFGSTAALNKELNDLFNFTKYTPFQFKDVTSAFRMLYSSFHPLGIDVATTNATLKALTDNLAYSGKTSPGQLQRVSLALQHMANQGHLTGYAVNQLSRDGVNMSAVLRKEFGLTGDQIHKIGTLGIPTIDVLKAIIRYTETTKGPMDAARRLALGSFHGQFTTFKDNMGQIMGAVEKGWFNRLQGFLTRTNAFFNTLAGAMKGGGGITGIITAIDAKLTPSSHSVLMFWHQLRGAVHDFWAVLSTLLGDLARSQILWGLVYVGLSLIHGVLWFLIPQMHIITGALTILLPMWLAWHVYLKLAAIWTGILAFEEAVLTKKTKELTFAQMLWRLWLDRSIYTEKIGIATHLIYATILEQVTLAQWSFAGAIDASIFRLKMLRLGMLGLAGLAISAIVLLTLIPRAKKNPDPNAPSNVPVQHGLAGLPLVGGFFSQVGAASDWLYYHTYGSRTNGGGRAPRITPRNPAWNGRLPHLAAGGWGSGLTWVGENGPELLNLPHGSYVTPNHQAVAAGSGPMLSSRQPIEIVLKVGERVLERIMTEIDTDRTARA